MNRVLIVCTGNTCRSPMAQAMLQDLAERAGKPLVIRSAGVAAVNGQPVSPHAASVLRKRSLKPPDGSARLTDADVAWAELILTMTSGHKRAILEKYPEAIAKTYTMREFALLHDPVMDDVREAERLYTEWQVKLALGQTLSEQEQTRMRELQRRLPNFDIDDPFGGSLANYERVADEIEDVLLMLLDKLETGDGGDRRHSPGEQP